MICSYLGQCYVFLERYEDAVKILSKAYDLFTERKKEMKEHIDRDEYNEFLKAYSYALHKVGEFEQSAKVKDELDTI